MESIPRFTAAQALEVAEREYGIGGRVSVLPSERDQNFSIEEPGGRRVRDVPRGVRSPGRARALLYDSAMKLYSWNVNGIRAAYKKGLFQVFLQAHRPDILCLQETKAERGQAAIDVKDYHEYWNSAAKKGYSGTAIFAKQEPLGVINGFPSEFARRYSFADELERDSAGEGRVITAEFEKFYVVTVYTPNAKDDLSRLALRYKHWDPAFLAYCLQLQKIKPVIFCGDLNVAHTELDLANPKPNRGKKGFTDEERKGFQNFIDSGFVDTFRLFKQGNGYYSWWSHFANSRARNVGWRIDYFLVSASLRKAVVSADIHPDVMGSDHCPVSVTLA